MILTQVDGYMQYHLSGIFLTRHLIYIYAYDHSQARSLEDKKRRCIYNLLWYYSNS